MTFMQEINQFKKIIRETEKCTKKCVRLNGTIEYKKFCFSLSVRLSVRGSLRIAKV